MQRRDPNSLLNWMERMIRMRKEVPEIGWGDFTFLEVDTNQVLAMLYEWRNNQVVVLHNLCPAPCELRLKLGRKGAGNQELVNLLSEDHSLPTKKGSHQILLEPYGYRWYRVGGLDYLLKRSES
jgi:maltose alpha-D-glucosyltransferase/alpha-amylase